MTPRPPHPAAIPKLDIRTTWSVEKRPRFGWRLRSHGLFHSERSTAFAFTQRGAERKARRWMAPPAEAGVAYTPLPRPNPTRPSPMQGETGRRA